MIDEETAKRIGEAIAKTWHWRAGCRLQKQNRSGTFDAARVYAVQYTDYGVWLSCHPESDPAATWHIPSDSAWPDFSDAASLGQLEETVDHVHGSAGPMIAAHLPFIGDWPNVWTVASTGGKPYMVGGWHPSKAEALFAAYLDATEGTP